MTAVTPPPAAPPPPPAAPPANLPASVAAPPQALLALPVGARLDAMVLAADPALEKLLVQTSLGPVSLQLPAPLPIPADARLVLQLTALNPVVQLLILSVDGAPPSAARQGGPRSAAPNPTPTPAQAPLAPAPADRISVGTVMQATFLRPPPQSGAHPAAAPGPVAGAPTAPHAAPAKGGTAPSPPGPSAPTAPSAPPSQTIAATVAGRLAASMPGKIQAAFSSWLTNIRDVPSAAPAAGSPANPGRTAAPAAPPPPAGSGAPPAALPPGTAFAVRVSALDGPMGAPPTSGDGGSLAQGQTVLATVVSSTPGHTLVETRAGTLILKTTGALPKGLTLGLEIAGSPRPPDTETAHPSPLRGQGWPALEEAVPHLRNEAPDLHRLLIAQMLPKPDQTLAAGLIMFLSALRAGDIRAWFGEDIARALGRGQPGLLRRLEDDFRDLAHAADNPGDGDWRVAVIPFNAQASIEQIRLLTRRPPRESKDPDTDRARFVIDVTLSRLGRIQLDGMVRRKDKRLDLMVRTAGPLPDAMRDDIRRLFARASEATGINGLLAFDARENGFVEVRTDLPPHSGVIA